jgi:hypothetical protein
MSFSHTHADKEGKASLAGEVKEPPEGSEPLQQLTADLRAIPSRFQVVPAAVLLDLPGIGVCVPDLTFIDADADARRVHFEMLGYWSRASVWKRVELVEAGLDEPVLFGVNQRLRVSEEVLDKDAKGALYVFRGSPNAKTLLERVERLAATVDRRRKG